VAQTLGRLLEPCAWLLQHGLNEKWIPVVHALFFRVLDKFFCCCR
jgi:hypothetical protein